MLFNFYEEDNVINLDGKSSLKWHYEVLRWFDEYVGEKK